MKYQLKHIELGIVQGEAMGLLFWIPVPFPDEEFTPLQVGEFDAAQAACYISELQEFNPELYAKEKWVLEPYNQRLNDFLEQLAGNPGAKMILEAFNLSTDPTVKQVEEALGMKL